MAKQLLSSTLSNGWTKHMATSTPSAATKMRPFPAKRRPDEAAIGGERLGRVLLDATEDALASTPGDHLGPDCLTVDDDLLAELRPELLLGNVLVASGDDSAVQEQKLGEEMVESLAILADPRIGLEHDVLDVVLLELKGYQNIAQASFRRAQRLTFDAVFLSYLPMSIA
jgi:hypothetical protein